MELAEENVPPTKKLKQGIASLHEIVLFIFAILTETELSALFKKKKSNLLIISILFISRQPYHNPDIYNWKPSWVDLLGAIVF